MSVGWDTREEDDFLAAHAEWMRVVVDKELAQKEFAQQQARARNRWAGLVLLISIGLVALLFWQRT